MCRRQPGTKRTKIPVLDTSIVSLLRRPTNRTAERDSSRADAHSDARQPLFAWFAEVEKADWAGPEDIKQRYPSASLVNKERIVFNIKGNNYRVIVAVKLVTPSTSASSGHTPSTTRPTPPASRTPEVRREHQADSHR